MTIHPLVFLDVETTGHEPVRKDRNRAGGLMLWNEIIDLAAVRYDPVQRKISGKYERKVIPQCPERCIRNIINHYPERALAGEWDDAVLLKDCIDGLFAFLREEPVPVLGGQNFFFDWTFMTAALASCGYAERDWSDVIHYSRFDTRSMAMQELWVPGTPYQPNDWSIRNDLLVQRLGIEPEPPVHTAINGALKSLEVFQALEKLRGSRITSA